MSKDKSCITENLQKRSLQYSTTKIVLFSHNRLLTRIGRMVCILLVLVYYLYFISISGNKIAVDTL